MIERHDGAPVDARADDYQVARAAYASGEWIDVLRHAGAVLAREPMHAGAAELVIAARRAVDVAERSRGEHRLLTVVFCDLVGSTALVADLGPESYRELMLEIHDLCVRAVTEYEGRIAQFLGDGVLAYFSYPQAHEDDARRAILAALSIVSEIKSRETAFTTRFGRTAACRIGIDTGNLVVGALGSGQWKTSDSIVGDAANIAARLQNEAQPNEILITDMTYQLAKDFIEIGSTNVLNLRNVAWPVHAHTVLGTADIEHRPEAVSRSRAPLVGRTKEVETLTDAWATVLAGHRRQLLIVGDAGTGKSRLVEHLGNLVNAGGGRHVDLRCSGVFAHSAFRPAATALRRVLDLAELDTKSGLQQLGRQLATFAPGGDVSEETTTGLACLLGLPVALDLLPEQIRLRTIRAFTDLVGVMARAAPLLLVVDDVHDADASTVELLTALQNDVRDPFMLLLTSRRPMPELAFSVPVVRLGPLSAENTEALVRSLVSDVGVDVAARVAARSDGVPLFAEELALAVNEGSASSYELPVGLTSMFTGRFDELDGRTREAAEAAAVLGYECAEELLREILDVPAEELNAALEGLVSRRLVVVSGSYRRDVRFRHALVRDAAYERQLGASRRRLHRRAARVLQARDAAGKVVDAGAVAGHLSAADERPDAFQWWQRAGAEAAAVAANVESVSHYRNALELLDVVDAGADRDTVEFDLQLRLAVGTSTTEGYTSEGALAAYERAEDLGTHVATSPAVLPAIWGMWSFHTVRGNHATGGRLADQATRIAAAAGDDQSAALVGAIRGYQEFYLGDLPAAERDLLIGCTGGGHPELPHDPAITSRSLLAIVRYLRGDTDRGWSDNAAAKVAAAGLTDRRAAFTRAYASAYSAWLHQLADAAADAAAEAATTIAIATENNFPTWVAAGSLHLAIARCALGDGVEWAPKLEAYVDLWRKVGAELLVPYFLGRLGSVMTDAGRVDEALAVLDEALSLVEVSAERFYQPELHRLKSAALRRAGAAPADVLAALDRAADSAHAGGSALLLLRALLDRRKVEVSEGQAGTSLPRLTEMMRIWPTGGRPPEVSQAIALLRS